MIVEGLFRTINHSEEAGIIPDSRRPSIYHKHLAKTGGGRLWQQES